MKDCQGAICKEPGYFDHVGLPMGQIPAVLAKNAQNQDVFSFDCEDGETALLFPCNAYNLANNTGDSSISFSVTTDYVSSVGNCCVSEPERNLGRDKCAMTTCSPINLATGNMYHVETDMDLGSNLPGPALKFQRAYNSQMTEPGLWGGPLGYSWTHNYNVTLRLESSTEAVLSTEDGKVLFFDKSGGTWAAQDGEKSSLIEDQGDFHWIRVDGTDWELSQSYYPPGTAVDQPIYLPASITDRQGNSLSLSYSQQSSYPINYPTDTCMRLSTVADDHNRSLSFSYDFSTGKLTQMTDPRGNNFFYNVTYVQGDPAGNCLPGGQSCTYIPMLTRVDYPGGGGTTYNYTPHPGYDGSGPLPYYYEPHIRQLESIVRDGAGTVAEFVYAYQGTPPPPPEVYSVFPPSGEKFVCTSSQEGTCRDIQVDYDPVLSQTTVTSAAGTTTVGYTKIGQTYEPESVSGAGCTACNTGGRTMNYAYSTDHNLTGQTDGNGITTNYQNFNIAGMPGTVTRDTRTDNITYHPGFPDLVTRVDTNGANARNFTYDLEGNLARVKLGGAGPEANYTYNSRGQVTETDGPRTDVTDVTTFSYDPVTGLLESVTDPLWKVTRFNAYDNNGNLTEKEDPNGLVTTYTWDEMNRIQTVTLVGAGPAVEDLVTTYTYSSAGDLTSVTFPEGNGVAYTHDYTTGCGQLETVTDTEGNSIQYDYDADGNLTDQDVYDSVPALKKWTDYQYNARNLLSDVILPGGYSESFSYDSGDRRTGYENGAGDSWTYGYDDLDRVTSVVQDQLGLTTGYTWTDLDRVETVTDPRGLVSTYTYNDYGWPASVASPDMGLVSFGQDDAGNVTSRTDALGTTGYTYDELNRLASIDPPGTGHEITYLYDDTTGGNYGAGRLTGMTDASGSTSWVYDKAGNIVREDRTVTGHGTFTTVYGYDGNGNPVSITYPDGRVVSYTMDQTDRVDSVSAVVDGSPQTLLSSVSYLPFGPAGSMTRGNGSQTTWTRDQRYALTGLASSGVLTLGYTVDGALRVTDVTGDHSLAFGYDAAGRLTSADGPWGAGSFTYDDSGNRLSKVLGSESTSYTVSGTSNRLLTATGTEAAAFGYDGAGNLTTEGTRSYVYNANQRLESVEEDSVPIGAYTYDGKGQRVVKSAGGQATLFLYDLAGRVLAEKTGPDWVDYVWLGAEPVAVISAETATCIDGDGDGYGEPASPACTYPQLDCDDTDPAVNPGATEGPVGDATCSDTLDNDCDGLTDSADTGCQESQPWAAASTVTDTSVLSETGASPGGSGALGTLALMGLPFGFVLLLRRLKSRKGEKGRIMKRSLSSFVNLLIIALVCAGLAGSSLVGSVPQAWADETLYYLYNDYLGTPQKATNEAGTVVWDASVRPFGRAEVSSGVIVQNLRFPGQYYDEESGLHYNYQRTYHPGLGRYLEPDPLGQHDSANVYPYALNNPVNFVDPLGQDAIAIVFPDYRIATPAGRVGGLGHAGILLIDPKTGLTKYYEYGRYDALGLGEVRNKSVPNVNSCEAEAPSGKSLQKVLGAISRQSGHGGRIKGAYVRDDNFEAMNKYAQQRMAENSNPERVPYGIISNNCGTFMKDVLDAGGVDTPWMIDPRPNSYIDELRDEFPPIDFP